MIEATDLNQSNHTNSKNNFKPNRKKSQLSKKCFTNLDKFKIEFLNTDIWNSMRANHIGRILKMEMNQLQLDECNRIGKFLKDAVLNKYRIRTTIVDTRRTKAGISFHLRCLKNLCNRSFRLFLNVFTKECEVVPKHWCEHDIRFDETNNGK